MTSLAPIILQALATHGFPLVFSLVERWSQDEPGNPVPADYLELLKAHSLTRTYDEQIQAAQARAGQA